MMGASEMSTVAIDRVCINLCTRVVEHLCCKANGPWSVNHIKKQLPDLTELFISPKSSCSVIKRTSVKYGEITVWNGS